MGRRLKIKKRKKEEKERPFDDSDTVIQWREDFVEDYIKDPLMRKAVELPIVERVVTERMEKDMLINDENDNLGVRTRERQLPAMPLDAEFMKNMRNAVPNTILKDIQYNLRCYNDSLRNPATRELSKVFLLGVVRQLRYWVVSQTPQPDVEEGDTAVDWVLDNLLGRIEQDMTLLSKHFSPEIDKVYFRRWYLELNILRHELELRKNRTDAAREELQEIESTPESDEPPEADVPSEDLVSWMQQNSTLVDIMLRDPRQRDQLLSRVWSEIFNHDGNIQYLNLIKELTLRAELNEQQTTVIQSLLDNIQHGNIESLDHLRSDARFTNFLGEILLIESTLEETHALWLLQRILDIFGGDPQTLPTRTLENPRDFSDSIRPPKQ